MKSAAPVRSFRRNHGRAVIATPLWLAAACSVVVAGGDEHTTASKAAQSVTDADREHWSFRPLARPTPPAVNEAAWGRTIVDRFILAKLESRGIAPNPIADRRRLVRRAYFDLIGLPPSPDEVEAFVNDPAPDAYERLIDRLLESPHYGERWGRHWLDLARFAESHGYEQDYDRPNAFHYRDFVIKALNQDLPYNTFVKWQIAGDEFAPDDPLALAATGFLAAGTHATQITANQAEKERYDELDDMARTIGTTMLGLSIGCARCHDHKFDPIPTADYYRLISTFATTVRSDFDVNLDPAAFREAKAKFDAAHAPLIAALETFERDELPGRLDAWLASRKASRDQSPPPESEQKDDKRTADKRPAASPFTWVVVEPAELKSEGGATFTKLDDGSLLVGGKNSDNDMYTLVMHTKLKGIASIRLEALAHESLVKGGPGRAANGNFGLTDFRVAAAPLGGAAQSTPVKLTNARASFDQQGLPVTNAIDGDKNSCWAVDPQFGKDHAAAFDLESPVGFDAGTRLTITLEFKCNKQHGIGRPRLALSTSSPPGALDAAAIFEPAYLALSAFDADPTARLSGEQRADILKWYRTTDAEWQKLNEPIRQHAKNQPQPKLAKMLISSEGVPAVRLHTQGLDFYDPTYFLKRGDPNQKAEVATQSFLSVLMRPRGDGEPPEKRWHEPPPTGSTLSFRRRALANWLTDVDSGAGHLLARVIVNRLWYYHMGRGIVATPSDFGRKGEPPSHPELLDWLASELIEPNGSRQSAVGSRGPEIRLTTADSRLPSARPWSLKHIHKLIMTSSVYMQTATTDERRLAADRDNSLFWHRPGRRLEAELIRDAMLAVSGSLDETQFGPGSLDPKHRRRSIYFFVKRSQLVPMMTVFDAPDSLQDLPTRSCTTIAPQALLLMNNVTVRDHATAFARRIKTAAGDSPADAVRASYAIALGRPPRDEELVDSVAFLKEQSSAYSTAGKSNAAELALADFCQTLMCLNEFVYVE